MAAEAQIEETSEGIGDKLEVLFSHLETDDVRVGIRERVMVGRLAAQIVEQKRTLPADQWAFLLRARLTAVLAKSPQDRSRIRRAFVVVFPESVRDDEQVDRPSSIGTGGATPPVLPGSNRQRRHRIVRLAATLAAATTVVAAVIVALRFGLPQQAVVQPGSSSVPTAPSGRASAGTAPNTDATTATLSAEQLTPLADQIRAAVGAIWKSSAASMPNVTILDVARHLPADPNGAGIRATISELQRYLPRAPNEPFAFDQRTLLLLVAALAERQYPGRPPSADAIAAMGKLRLTELLSHDPSGQSSTKPAEPQSAPSPQPQDGVELPQPLETFVMAPWFTVSIVAAPLLLLIIWSLGQRRRLKDYLRRRTPERPPLVHNLVVHASGEISRERLALTRAALRLGRSRQGLSRTIDPEATANATAAAAGFPHIVFSPARIAPEYLVLISNKGSQDHAARQLDRLVEELAAQNLSLVRYFIAHDANLCFDSPNGSFYTIDQLADLYPDRRLIFLGTGEQFLNPGTLAAWPWAEELISWEKRAMLTPKPIQEWGAQEVALARLFDAPPMRANAEGLLRLAELFERQDAPGAEFFDLQREPRRWSWTSQPQLWLIPLQPDEDEYRNLESELARYFLDDAGGLDEEAFCWFAACAIYPGLRWDLTVYLGLKLTSSTRGTPLPLYSDERALKLAVLPWFRDGYMPDWLRSRLVALLPNDIRRQAVALLRDILERAIRPDGEAYDVLRLRIAQERSDPMAARPERDEIFLDVLAGADPLALEVPRSLRELIGTTKSEFARREWTSLGVILLYWIAAVLIAVGPSGDALMTAAWLPLALLLLAFVSVPAARRLRRFTRGRAEREAIVSRRAVERRT